MTEFFNTPFLGDYFQYIILYLVAWALILCARGVIYDNKIVSVNQMLGLMTLLIVVMLMGMRPASSDYGDTVNYAYGFNKYAQNKDSIHFHFEREWLFGNTMRFFAKYSNIHAFFITCAIVYVGALWLALRRIFDEYNFVPLLVVMSMFTFWQYGVNGVRNGMGASMFILAMTYTNNIPMMLGIAFVGAGFHNSVYIMFAAATLAWILNNSRLYMLIWGTCIVLSFTIGSMIQSWMAGFAGSIDEGNKLTSYLTYSTGNMLSEGIIVSTSFRWDFVAYSGLGVAIGAYFILRRRFEDEYYRWIFNTYLLCNSFWILIIRAPYSNRFAQISWFILPIVLIYPFMRERFWVNQEKMLGLALVLFFAFNFITNTIPALLR